MDAGGNGKMRKEKVLKILAALDREYGTDDRCYLDHENDWQFLFAVILSAQCTDKRVNEVTPELFRKFPDLQSFRDARITEIEKAIHSIGFYHAKARNLKNCAAHLLSDFNGTVPDEMEKLLTLPGVGRKTANVILGNVYRKPSVVVDTHVRRISEKLGLTKETDPEKVEYDLMKVLPQDHWILYNMQVITLGRTVCTARNPKCETCFLKELCPAAEVKK